MTISKARAVGTPGEIASRAQWHPGKLRRQELLYAVLMVLPTLLAVLAVTAYPFGYSAWLSLHRIDLGSKHWTFVGLGNYSEVIPDPEFRAAFVRTLIFSALTVVGGAGLGLVMALVLNERFRGRGIMRSILLIPWAMSGVVVGYLWGWIFDGQYGTLNGLLYQFYLINDYIPYMSTEHSALLIVALVYIWNQAPLAAPLFLAALQAIPQNLYRAATIDGASAIQRFFHVTVPWLRPMALLVVILTTINSVLAFDLFWIMTKGGPGSSTTVFSWLGYADAFLFFKFGQGAAVLYILSILCLILAAIYLRLLQEGRGRSRHVTPADEAAPAVVGRTVRLGGSGRFVRDASVRTPRLSGRVRQRFRQAALLCGVLAIAAWTLLPFLWLITCSLSNTVDLLGRPPRFIPWPPTFANFRNIFLGEGTTGGFGGRVSAQKVPLGLRNSFEVSLAVTAINVVVGTLAGYGYARFRHFAFMRATLWALMMTRMIPGLALAIPFFILFRTVNLLDSKLALVISYTSFILPLTVWIMKGYFETIPPSLERAALVDGCTRFHAFLRVIVPVALPGIAAAAIFCFLVSWNEFLFALLLTDSPNSQTITVVISGFTQQVRSSQYGAIFASGVVAVLPPVFIALLFQKYLVQGMLSGSTKG